MKTTMKNFNGFTQIRKELQDLCNTHPKSLEIFKYGDSFKINHEEELNNDTDLHHMTTTATCIESILEISDIFLPKNDNNKFNKDDLIDNFIIKALKREFDEWKAEGSAEIYCRCRALPLIISNIKCEEENGKFIYKIISNNGNKYSKINDYLKIHAHISYILLQLSKNRKAIGEICDEDARDNNQSNNKKEINNNHYPENAYHTFFTLKILDFFIKLNEKIYLINRPHINNGKESTEEEKILNKEAIEEIKTGLLDWSETFLEKQIAYHEANSSYKDSDQLAWVLSILTRFREDLSSASPIRDLIKKGFECLFNAQRPDGSWITGKPLFHFKNAGDAHCYMFETFSEIIKTALKKENDFLRQLLEINYEKLINMIKYANSTCIYYKDPRDKDLLCLWSSGHRTNNLHAESWATASVYAFFQQMRRLIGYWTKKKVLKNLHKPNITIYSQENSLEKIRERGFVWSFNKKGIQPSEHLLNSFVNPILLKSQEQEIEPDKYVISENQSRSAILFGPPGTCKTTLVKSIAGAIGWDYIEIHASDFLSEGLPNIHKKADEIFNQLMELDQTVILFDEIDELVRSREKEDGSDIYGRFLTTTMLPKIAQLWEQRKVIFFVATNFLENFDYAIIRGNRFDSLIYIPPPSFERKKSELIKILKEQYNRSCKINATKKEINDIVKEIQANIKNINNNDKDFEEIINKTNWSLVKFVLIRYDQLSSLAKQLYEEIPNKNTRGNGTDKNVTYEINKKLLETALNNIPDPGLKKALVIERFIKEKDRTQRNFDHVTVWEVDKPNPPNDSKFQNHFIKKEADKFLKDVFVKNEKDEKYWYIPRCSEIDEKLLKERGLVKEVNDKKIILNFKKAKLLSIEI